MTDYIALVEHHGLSALIAVTIIAVLAPLLIHLSEHKWRFRKGSHYLSQLTEHSFFSQVQYWRNIGIDAIQIEDEGRSLIFKDLLHIQFRVFEIAMRNIIHHPDINSLSALKLKQLVIREITQALTDCEMEAIQMGIPDIVRRKFAKWHYRSILFLMNGIEGTCTSAIYKNNTQRLNALLSFVLAAFYATLIDAEKTLNQLNGELVGVNYKDHTVKK